MVTKAKIASTLSFLAILCTHSAFSDQTVINNSTGQPQQAAPQCGGNQNNIYDPRVPPEGAYVVKNGDGTSNQIYTTGEKKPYYVDNYCNQPYSSQAQPYIFFQPGGNGPKGGGGHR